MPDLIGHEWVVAFLRRAVAEGHAHHAYLLTGPTHIGKLATAMAMARLLLCGSNTACGNCRHCGLAERNAHPDLRVLQLPADRKTIPIRDVHEFSQGIALKPLEAARKVYIIDSADLLSEDGANALLKTLEEPPPAVTLMLTATDPARLLPTIVSRCQRIALRPVPAEAIAAHLVEVKGLERRAADSIARTSHGRPGWAVLAAADPKLTQERAQRIAELIGLLGNSPLERLKYADALAERWSSQADEVTSTLEVWVDAWRDVMRVQTGLDVDASVESTKSLVAAGEALSASEVTGALASTVDTLEALRANAHPRLALEALLLLWPRPRVTASAQ